MKTFQSLLSLNELTALYISSPSLVEYFFTKTFFGSPQNVNSDEVEIISVGPTTRPGPGNSRGAAARVIQPKGGTKRFASIFHQFDQLTVPTDCLHALREPESYGFQEKGRTALQLQVDEFAIKTRLFKEIVLRSILVNHRVNMDANGNLLEPSVTTASGAITDASGTAVSADFGVADSHRGDCGDITTALWSTAGTKIGEQLDIYRRQAARNGCPKLETVLTNGLNKSALRNNTEFNDWAKYNSTRPDAVLRGEGIDGLWGFNWRFVDGTYTDVNGTTYDLIPQTVAVLLPSLTQQSWLRKFAGSELVPSSVEIQNDAMAALNSLMTVYGEYMYATVTLNPPNLNIFGGEHFGLGLPDLNCLYRVTAFAALSNLPTAA